MKVSGGITMTNTHNEIDKTEQNEEIENGVHHYSSEKKWIQPKDPAL